MDFFYLLIGLFIATDLQALKEKSSDQIELENWQRNLSQEEKNKIAMKKEKHEAWLKRKAEREEQKRIQAFRDEIKSFERQMGVYD